jgi:hypothetical protein
LGTLPYPPGATDVELTVDVTGPMATYTMLTVSTDHQSDTSYVPVVGPIGGVYAVSLRVKVQLPARSSANGAGDATVPVVVTVDTAGWATAVSTARVASWTMGP